MNQKQQKICIFAVFAVFVAALYEIIRAIKSHAVFDVDSFILEAVVFIIVGAIYFSFSKPN